MYKSNEDYSDNTSAIEEEVRGPLLLGPEEEDILHDMIMSSLTHARGSSSREGGPSTASSSRASEPTLWNPGLQRLIASQTPPGHPRLHISDPATFRLHHTHKGTFLGEQFGHICLNPTSRWNKDGSRWWSQRRSAGKWFWNNGKPCQVACEAAWIPFDQWLLAQRWVVHKATINSFLPIVTTSWEPDVGQMAADNMLLSYICQDPDG